MIWFIPAYGSYQQDMTPVVFGQLLGDISPSHTHKQSLGHNDCSYQGLYQALPVRVWHSLHRSVLCCVVVRKMREYTCEQERSCR